VYNGKVADWIGHTLCKNCLLVDVSEGEFEGRIEVTKIRRSGSKQLLADVRETRGYWKLKAEALDLSVWRNGFGRGVSQDRLHDA